MSDPHNVRKVEHIDIVNTEDEVDRNKNYFDRVHLTHRALPEVDLAAVDPSCEILGKRLSFPLLISCMTGGDNDRVRTANRNLALAAESTGIAMGVGSQRVMFTSPEAKSSFEVRPQAPTSLLFANLGAVQLNCGFTIEHARAAVAAAGADALVFHLNPLQEAVQPDGNTNFAGLAEKIIAVAAELEQPVVVKEVGAGISRRDVDRLIDGGIRTIDVAGSGGTSWSRIEHHRQPVDGANDLGLLFQDWGIPTPLALQQLRPHLDRLTLIASGGIRTGIDMAKAIVLGASLCGVAKPFIEAAMESSEAVVAIVERFRREFVTAMFLLGAATVADLYANDDLVLAAPRADLP